MKDHGISKTFWDEISRIRSIMRDSMAPTNEENKQS